jgi:hypothetical protein
MELIKQNLEKLSHREQAIVISRNPRSRRNEMTVKKFLTS